MILHSIAALVLAAYVAALQGHRSGFSEPVDKRDSTVSIASVCRQIGRETSNASNVYWPSSDQYEQGITHYASSSAQKAVCSVEPGTAEDVGVILKVMGSTRIPFAVKSGGHALNPGFSSTSGVQVSLNRFNQTIYHADSQSATVGTGQIWDEVYAALAPFNVNVVGGRVSGIGIGGFVLGGGYSWITNQYGLALDNVLAYELVLPNGTISEITASNPDLFFGLRGGFNNFGIVTKFTLKTHPQTQVWGGEITYFGDKFEELQNATSNFITNNRDPKAAIITAFGTLAGLPSISLLIFYDAPMVPAGVFDELLAIDYYRKDVSTRSFLSLVQAGSANILTGLRQRYNTVSLTGYSKDLMKVIANETLFWGTELLSAGPLGISKSVSYAVESFTPDIFTHGPPSAYPPDRSRALLPLSISYAWSSEQSDEGFVEAIKATAAAITSAADAEGQNIGNAALYGNYAVDGTPVSRIYGANLPRLEALKAKYDPENVMGLTGGWKI